MYLLFDRRIQWPLDEQNLLKKCLRGSLTLTLLRGRTFQAIFFGQTGMNGGVSLLIVAVKKSFVRGKILSSNLYEVGRRRENNFKVFWIEQHIYINFLIRVIEKHSFMMT